SSLHPGTARPAMRRMARISGRSDDMIILRGVNLFPSQIEEIALRIPALSPHFQLELTRSGHRDEMTIHIEPRPDSSEEERAAAADTLRRQVKTHIGSTCVVDIAAPGSLA